MVKKTRKLNLGPVPHPNNDRFKIPTDPGMPGPLPVVGCFCGKPRSSKSTLSARLAKMYIEKGMLNRHQVYVVSPSRLSNKHLWEDYLGLPPDNIIGSATLAEVKDALSSILDKVKEAKNVFDDQQAYRDAYYALANGEQLTQQQMTLLEQNDAMPPSGNEPYPRFLVICDDLQGVQGTLSKQFFISMILRFRHLCGVGVSFFILIQSLRGQGGLARSIRQSCSFFVLYGTHDKSATDNLAEECSQHVSKEGFYQMFRDATKEPFGFLVVDLTQDRDHVFSASWQRWYTIREAEH